jgi:hypothetical protein
MKSDRSSEFVDPWLLQAGIIQLFKRKVEKRNAMSETQNANCAVRIISHFAFVFAPLSAQSCNLATFAQQG